MYKALNLDTFDEINILQSRWKVNLSDLRLLDRQDQLGCPGCRQPVRIRAGKRRRWHFAHKHLVNCPLSRQSPMLLDARAVLYDWLVSKYGENSVEVEKEVPDLPRPVDAWVKYQNSEIAYWVHDVRLSPCLRTLIGEKLDRTANNVHYLFLKTMLRVDDEQMDRIHLTTTEREFMRPSQLDIAAEASGESPGRTLHYLDSQQKTITSYRRLRLHHPPQRYKGRRVESELRFISIILETGEILHRDEEIILRRQLLVAEAAQRRLDKKKLFYDSAIRSTTLEKNDQSIEKEKRSPEKKDKYLPLIQGHPFKRSGKCIHCGKETADWVTFIGKTGECICRDCQAKENDTYGRKTI